MADDNRLPTNQSQLDIATALNGIASALTPQNTVNADSVYPVETSPSTHAYNEGDHLIVSGVTYVAIDDIAIGDSLVLNTNIQAETLATRMNHIEDGIESTSQIVDSLNNNSVNAFTAVTGRVQLLEGGYTIKGNMVFVNIKFKALATLTNKPAVLLTNSSHRPTYDCVLSALDITNGIDNISESIPCGIATTGYVYVTEITTDRIYRISGWYQK